MKFIKLTEVDLWPREGGHRAEDPRVLFLDSRSEWSVVGSPDTPGFCVICCPGLKFTRTVKGTAEEVVRLLEEAREEPRQTWKDPVGQPPVTAKELDEALGEVVTTQVKAGEYIPWLDPLGTHPDRKEFYALMDRVRERKSKMKTCPVTDDNLWAVLFEVLATQGLEKEEISASTLYIETPTTVTPQGETIPELP